MSLIIGLAYQDQFVIAANDSKVTVQQHDENTLEKLNVPVREAGFQEEKIKRLTDKVLYCGSGILDTVKLIESELFKRVQPSDDLNKCAEILENLLQDLRNGNITFFRKSKKEAVKYLDTTYVTIELLGFTNDGISGLVRTNPIEKILNITMSPMNGTYPIFIDCPKPEEDLEFQQYLGLPINEQTLENFINRFIFIHAHLSHKHSVSVSSDCNFHILFKHEGEFKYWNKTIDTFNFYEELGLEPEEKKQC
jgi:hypothetical protein